MSTEFLAQILAIPGAAACILWIGKRGVALLLEQHQKIQAMQLAALSKENDELKEQLKSTRSLINEQLLPRIDDARHLLIKESTRMDSLEKVLDRHSNVIETSLPRISTEIGKLSLYWKQTKEKP